eukprot:7604358-Prorocentrum_lima.AAC.1
MQLDDGTWKAFMAERLPQLLDDEIKRSHEAFYNSARNLEPGALKDLLPMAFPMTNPLVDEAGVEHLGIARYPIDEWKAHGAPVMETK